MHPTACKMCSTVFPQRTSHRQRHLSSCCKIDRAIVKSSSTTDHPQSGNTCAGSDRCSMQSIGAFNSKSERGSMQTCTREHVRLFSSDKQASQHRSPSEQCSQSQSEWLLMARASDASTRRMLRLMHSRTQPRNERARGVMY